MKRLILLLPLLFLLPSDSKGAAGQAPSGAIRTTNAPFAGAVLHSDGTIFYWALPTAASTNIPPYVLTNAETRVVTAYDTWTWTNSGGGQSIGIIPSANAIFVQQDNFAIGYLNELVTFDNGNNALFVAPPAAWSLGRNTVGWSYVWATNFYSFDGASFLDLTNRGGLYSIGSAVFSDSIVQDPAFPASLGSVSASSYQFSGGNIPTNRLLMTSASTNVVPANTSGASFLFNDGTLRSRQFYPPEYPIFDEFDRDVAHGSGIPGYSSSGHRVYNRGTSAGSNALVIASGRAFYNTNTFDAWYMFVTNTLTSAPNYWTKAGVRVAFRTNGPSAGYYDTVGMVFAQNGDFGDKFLHCYIQHNQLTIQSNLGTILLQEPIYIDPARGETNSSLFEVSIVSNTVFVAVGPWRAIATAPWVSEVTTNNPVVMFEILGANTNDVTAFMESLYVGYVDPAIQPIYNGYNFTVGSNGIFTGSQVFPTHTELNTASNLLYGLTGGGSTNNVAMGVNHLTTSNAVQVARTNVTGTTVNIDWNGPSEVFMMPSGTYAASFTNTPSAGSHTKRLHVSVLTQQSGTWANTGPLTIDWGEDGQPIHISGVTNEFVFAFTGTNIMAYNLQDLTTGTGAIVRSNTPSLYNAQLKGDTAFVATNGLNAYIRAASSNAVAVTNIVGKTEAASSSVIVLDANVTHKLSVTNRLTAATTVVLTNGVNGQELSLILIGEASGGSSRVVTLVCNTGALMADLDTFGTALANSTSQTVTNGNAVEYSIGINRLNGTNIYGKISRQFSF